MAPSSAHADVSVSACAVRPLPPRGRGGGSKLRCDASHHRAGATPLWLFDLDNTLHNAGQAIFPAISRNMNRYMAQVLRASGQAHDAATVDAYRQAYYQRYGATLLGMIRHHGVRAEEFLQAAHEFEDLPGMLRAERGLRNLLRALPGRKILLTNAPQAYARQVLRHLGLQRHFAEHVAVEQMRVHRQWQPKPSRPFLRKLLARYRLSARRAILVEDSLENLRAAKRVGLRTVWVQTYLSEPSGKKSAACVDVTVKSLRHLARARHLLSSI